MNDQTMGKMKQGIPASKGYAIGRAVLKDPNPRIIIIDEKELRIEEEQERLGIAVEKARQQLTALRDKTAGEMGEDVAAIFDSHLKLLEDPELIEAAIRDIQAKQVSAARSVQDIINTYVEIFSQLEDPYIRERAVDIQDVGQRLLRCLTGQTDDGLADLPENTVIIAYDLTPSDTALLDKTKVVAFLTEIGGSTSHSAIMAKTLEIPAVVGLENITAQVKTGDRVIVDGMEGRVFIHPDEAMIQLYHHKKKEFEDEKRALKKLVHTKTVTKAGKPVQLAANIGRPEEVDQAIANGAEGIGLFRTEFLYMDRDELPTEDQQFQAYKEVAEKMGGRPVIIRTLDIGGDKRLPYLPLPKEMNPFLGRRAIRLCLARPDIFRIQLRAILRASVFGNIRVMFPMISALDEFLEARKVLQKCMKELKGNGILFNEKIKTGMMIEIPSAAIIATELVKYADFFSIGTNDLVQYTLAVDRMNETVSYLYQPMHPAVLKLIKMTIDAARQEGKECGICGELAGNPRAIPTLLELGLDEFSMNAASILEARKQIISL